MSMTPIPFVNEAFGGGFKRGEFVIIGGDAGVAKTALMLEWARYAADPGHGGHPSAIISVEMLAGDLGQRLIAQNAQVSATAIRGGDIGEGEWDRIHRIQPILGALPITIWDDVVDIRQVRRIIHARPDLRLLFVDYLQLLDGPPSAARYQEIGAIAKLLKRYAKKYRLTVVALCSITPPIEEKGKRRAPTRHNLRESRDLDFHADAILMLWRPNLDSTTRELIIDKARGGASGGRTDLAFTPMYLRFQETL